MFSLPWCDRIALAVLVVWVMCGLAFGDDAADRERRVRVALALAGTAPAECGKCREDVAEVRADALRDGKPVVLFVGGCPGPTLAVAAEKAGAIPAKAPTYGGDATKQIVVLHPNADRSGFVRSELPVTSSPAEVTAAVKPAPPPKKDQPAKLDWRF